MISSKENDLISVIDKTYKRFVQDIQNGRFSPGEKLPGDRELAKCYGVGRSSMIKVLSMLKEERYVERVPVFGTFIRNDILFRSQTVNIAFVTPDASLSPDRIGFFSWSAMTEVLRGVFEEASGRPGVRVTLLYCCDTADPSLLKRQLEDISRFNGVIFCGHLMSELKQSFLQQNKPAMVILPKRRQIPERYPVVDIESEDMILRYANHIAGIADGRTVCLLHRRLTSVDRKESDEILSRVSRELAIRQVICEQEYLNIELESDEDVMAYLTEHFGTMKCFSGKIVWCMNRRLVPLISHLLLKNRVDAELFALTSGVVLSNIYPPVNYLREPFYEVGRSAVRMLSESCLSAKPVTDVILEPVFYKGSSPARFVMENP